ncbi:hypothetical protein, partial [Salmonella sp. s51090]|uniref:hypothetical protein n=1 Tax=Salmonella sp. s51090 TaxID=3159651 RepID=UPI0039800B95
MGWPLHNTLAWARRGSEIYSKHERPTANKIDSEKLTFLEVDAVEDAPQTQEDVAPKKKINKLVIPQFSKEEVKQEPSRPKPGKVQINMHWQENQEDRNDTFTYLDSPTKSNK